MNLEGRVKHVFEAKTYGSSGFQKRELIITTTEEQYPQTIAIEFLQDRCSLIDNIQVGQMVRVGINIRGREWTNPDGEVKYFNSIVGWRIEPIVANTSTPNQGEVNNIQSPPTENPFQNQTKPPSTSEQSTGDSAEDDLPF